MLRRVLVLSNRIAVEGFGEKNTLQAYRFATSLQPNGDVFGRDPIDLAELRERVEHILPVVDATAADALHQPLGDHPLLIWLDVQRMMDVSGVHAVGPRLIYGRLVPVRSRSADERERARLHEPGARRIIRSCPSLLVVPGVAQRVE